MREAGADTDLVSIEDGEVQAFNHLDKEEFAEGRHEQHGGFRR